MRICPSPFAPATPGFFIDIIYAPYYHRIPNPVSGWVFKGADMFELAGKVSGFQELKSAKGNDYAIFILETRSGSRFDLSLFGQTMEYCDLVSTAGTQVRVIGNVTSREYQDKNGKTRYGVQLQVTQIAPAQRQQQQMVAGAPQSDASADSFDLPF